MHSNRFFARSIEIFFLDLCTRTAVCRFSRPIFTGLIYRPVITTPPPFFNTFYAYVRLSQNRIPGGNLICQHNTSALVRKAFFAKKKKQHVPYSVPPCINLNVLVIQVLKSQLSITSFSS